MYSDSSSSASQHKNGSQTQPLPHSTAAKRLRSQPAAASALSCASCAAASQRPCQWSPGSTQHRVLKLLRVALGELGVDVMVIVRVMVMVTVIVMVMVIVMETVVAGIVVV